MARILSNCSYVCNSRPNQRLTPRKFPKQADRRQPSRQSSKRMLRVSSATATPPGPPTGSPSEPGFRYLGADDGHGPGCSLIDEGRAMSITAPRAVCAPLRYVAPGILVQCCDL